MMSQGFVLADTSAGFRKDDDASARMTVESAENPDGIRDFVDVIMPS